MPIYTVTTLSKDESITTLIHLLITNTNNAKYIILAMQMLIDTLHQREVLGHDKKDALYCFYVKSCDLNGLI
jgi:hypothetical protein